MEADLQKELIRKSMHLFIGSAFAALIYFGFLSALSLSIFFIISLSLMFFIHKTKKRIPLITDILDVVSRDKEFPGYGALTLIFGILLSMVLFSKDIAVASILILSIGDAVSPIIGMHFGKTKTKLSKTKLLEGVIAGTLLSFIVVIPLVGYTLAFFGATISMLLEFWDETSFIDDNLLIPLVAGTVMTIINLI